MIVLLAVFFLTAMFGYPYWWAAICRMRMLRRLERVCRENGFRFRPLKKPLWFVRNRGDKYELLIENQTRVLAVKLWSAYRRDSVLVLARDGKISERRQAPVVLDVRRNAQGTKSVRGGGRVRRTILPLSQKDRRSVTKLLLVYPSYQKMMRQTGEGEISLHSGDVIFDKILISPSALEKLLTEEKIEKEGQNPTIILR